MRQSGKAVTSRVRKTRPVRKGGARLIPVLAALALVGCVEYVPVDVGALRPDEEVRIAFDEETAIRLSRSFGRITERLEGSVAPRGEDSLSVSIWLGREYRGTAFENVRQTVAVSRTGVTELRRRELSVWKTAVASAGAAAAFAFMINRVFFQENPNPPGSDDTPPPPPPERILLRIPIGGVRR